MYKKTNTKNNLIAVLKGLLERIFLTFSLISNLTAVIIFFGAIKIATRISEGKESRISNDQFLVGNIISVALSIIYFKLWGYFNSLL